MIKVLINAYACSPEMGSEPGMAWNWCVNLANYCELHIITEGEFREKIEEVLPALSQAKNMHFYYNPLSEEIRKMCWNQGDWRFYKYYENWQFKTYQMAQEIVGNHKIDILHQLNMIGFREPGYLWRIKEIPLVWGPVDAKEKFPVAYLEGASLKTKVFTRIKNSITFFQLKYFKRIKQVVKQSSVVISASSNSQKTFKKVFKIESPLLNETGCYVKEQSIVTKKDKKELDILWVGKLDFRKQLSIAIKTIARMDNTNINLHIVGGGDDKIYKELAEKEGVTNQCMWYGIVDHNEVQELMRNLDVFFFTSVAEGTPHVVLEALGNSLPVVCFDTCGQGDSVNEKVGRKIALSNPLNSVNAFAKELNIIYNNRNLLKEMSNNCYQRQIELSWEKKAKQMLCVYNDVLNSK